MRYAKLSDAGQKVFDARYAQKDEHGNVIEDFAQAVDRIASAAAGAEKGKKKKFWESKFQEAIGNLTFVPSTPIWANVGKSDRPWQPSACFVLALEDSLESMYDTLKNTALVFKSGGGVGYNFSPIRPKGTIVMSTKGQASGVVELIRLYDASSGMVMQGGVRRGASMGILNIDHPEIIDFINCKRDGTITHFNLSVGITDAFMEAKAKNADWPLVFNGRVYQVVRARELWNMITEAAHACGDPGLIFLDRLQRDNPVPSKVINATNPCVTGDTWVITSEGPRQVVELIGRQFEAVVNGIVRLSGTEGFFETGTKPVVRLSTREGYTLRLTADHKVLRAAEKTRYRIHTEWVAASELKPGDQICLHNHRLLNGWPGPLTEGEGYLLGLLVGDGTLKAETAVLTAYTNGSISTEEYGIKTVMEQAVGFARQIPHRADFKGWHTVKGRNEFRLKLASLRDIALSLGMTPGNKIITPAIERTSSDCYRGFLRGLFDADGTVVVTQEKGVSVRLAQSNLELLRAVQRMLLRLGIASDIYSERRSEGFKLLPDSNRNPRQYVVKTQHELVISKDNLQLFADRIGFADSLKATKLASLLGSYKRMLNRERFVATVLSVEDDGSEPVYDVQIPGVNAFDANGIYVHNCGEQPLYPGESCLLGSISLDKMLRQTKNGYVIDWDKLREATIIGVRFLDDIIDVAEYPLDFIAEATRATRKIGLGITGLHDLLIMLGLPYDSEEGRKAAGEVMRFIQETAHRYSEELGAEKGPFPDWEQSIFFPHSKRRNAACITIAPTGSVTTMAGCEGYGIEPIFAVAYSKATDVAGIFEVFSPLFRKACERHGVPREVMSEVARRGSCVGVEGIPEEIAAVFKGAQDIAPEDHILMQIELQKYVDNAISKTINLPNSATIYDIEQAYEMAYAGNLKGITVFRDGCKEGVVTVGKGKERQKPPGELERGEIRPRPANAQGVTHRLDSGCGKIYLTVNYIPETGEIIETFITTGSDGGCLIYTEATSRLISLAIRGGISIDEIVGQLMSTHACPSYQFARGRGKPVSPGKSCASAIARKLVEIRDQLAIKSQQGKLTKQLNGDDEEVEEARDICPGCKTKMRRAEGCFVCQNCGYSKC